MNDEYIAYYIRNTYMLLVCMAVVGVALPVPADRQLHFLVDTLGLHFYYLPQPHALDKGHR